MLLYVTTPFENPGLMRNKPQGYNVDSKKEKEKSLNRNRPEPQNKKQVMSSRVIWPRSRQCPGAILEILQVSHTQQTHTDIRLGIVLIPVGLITNERLPLIVDAGVYTQDLVRRQDKDVRVGWVLQSVVVELDVPYAHSCVERPCRGLNEALLCGRMGADEGSKIVSAESLVCKEGDEIVGAVVDVWEKAGGGSLGCIFAADEGADARTLGA
jgi:hypothetical protein